MSRLEILDRIIQEHQVRLVEGFWIDVQTARAMRMIYDALNEQNKNKFLNLPLKRAVDFTWKHIK